MCVRLSAVAKVSQMFQLCKIVRHISCAGSIAIAFPIVFEVAKHISCAGSISIAFPIVFEVAKHITCADSVRPCLRPGLYFAKKKNIIIIIITTIINIIINIIITIIIIIIKLNSCTDC